MNTNITKSKSERKNKQRRKRYLKKKKKQFNPTTCSNIKSLILPQSNNSSINWKVVNMAANYWSQSRATMLDWQHKHEVAYWKAKAEALSYENKILHSLIQNIYSNRPEEQPKMTNKQISTVSNKQIKDENESEEEMEVSEEFLSYLKTSLKHKMELKKSKDEEEDSFESMKFEVDRVKEMQLLYGKSSVLIIGLETKVNLNYDSYKDKNKPEYWPYCPLNLSN